MHDPPDPDVRDDPFDLVADSVDGSVVSPVVGMKGQVRGFSLRGDHAQPDIPLSPICKG